MWLVLGNKTRARRVDGGREGRRFCPDCNAIAAFVECDVTDKVDLFFVEVLHHTMRRMVCLECGTDLGIEEFFLKESSRAPAKVTHQNSSPKSRSVAVRRTIGDAEKEEMLAALKRKMRGEE